MRTKMETTEEATKTEDATKTEEVQRVTDPRQKDPRKVEAGQKGAAARKAKQERLLEELRAAKQSLQPADAPDAVPQPPKQQPKQQLAPPPTDWTPWILVGAGLAALAYTSRAAASAAAKQPAVPQAPASGGGHQLKVSDPFLME